MPKSLVLGNGTMLVGLDAHGRIKDLYYDYVGLENHLTSDAVCRIGAWVDGEFSWFSDGSWNFDINYQKESMVGQVVAKNERLKIQITLNDSVYNEKNIFIRNIEVVNQEQRDRKIKVFLNHQLRMYGVEKRDTVYYDPADKTIIHYKGRRVALIGGVNGKKGFDQFNVGLSNIEGKEGTWKDAEDGILSKNPIEHGTVDSTISFEENLKANATYKFSTWLCMGKSLSEVKDLHRYIKKRGAENLQKTTKDFWHAWVNKTDFSFYGLSDRVQGLFKKSLLIIRTHVDNTGGIIASADSGMLQDGRDNYSYVWHRDGAFVAMALDKAGYSEVARKFYEFSNDTITDDGYFFHKYRSDKSLGSSWHGWMSPEGKQRIPIQEDETALLISALWKHYLYTKDLEFIENIYNSLIKKASEFMLGFRTEKNLPEPTFDLWEKEWGVHTFTAATVLDALRSAAKFAGLLGKESDEENYLNAAGALREAIIENLYDEETGYFHKYVNFEEENVVHNNTIDASSFFGAFRFGVLDIDDPRLTRSFEVFKNKLKCKCNISGVARFENDDYYKISEEFPGNPWIVTTLWLAQYLIMKAESEKDMDEVKDWFEWAADRALPSGVLPEQVNPHTGEQISASPLTWSHAEFVYTVIAYLEKLETLGVCKVSNPVYDG